MLLVFIGKFDAGPGEQRPAGAEPDDQFPAWTFSLIGHELSQRFERQIKTLGRAIETLRPADGAQAGFVLVV